MQNLGVVNALPVGQHFPTRVASETATCGACGSRHLVSREHECRSESSVSYQKPLAVPAAGFRAFQRDASRGRTWPLA